MKMTDKQILNYLEEYALDVKFSSCRMVWPNGDMTFGSWICSGNEIQANGKTLREAVENHHQCFYRIK